MPSRQGNEQLAMNIRERAGSYDQSSISRGRKGHNSVFDLTRVSHVERAYFYADRRRDRLDHRELGDPAHYVSKYRNPSHLRGDLVK